MVQFVKYYRNGLIVGYQTKLQRRQLNATTMIKSAPVQACSSELARTAAVCTDDTL